MSEWKHVITLDSLVILSAFWGRPDLNTKVVNTKTTFIIDLSNKYECAFPLPYCDK